MPIFVVLCLILAIIVQTESSVQTILASPVLVYIGLTVAIVTIIATFFKRLPESISYDLFSSGVLLTWFSYWKPLFVKDSPIFFCFPVYFALLIAFVSLFFIGQRHKIDRLSLGLMQSIVASGVIDPWFAMVCVLVTLYFEDHFLQYPVMMTLLTLRYALYGCLKEK